MSNEDRTWCTYLDIIEYMLGRCSNDNGGDSGVFVLLLSKYNDFTASDFSHLNPELGKGKGMKVWKKVIRNKK